MTKATDNLSTADLLRLMADRVEALEQKVAEKPPTHEANAGKEPSRYRIAPNCIGKVAITIWAMYKAGWFVKVNGSPATNVEDVARSIGVSLDEDFPNWKQTLQAVFDKIQPLDAIWEMEGEIKKRVEQQKKG